MQRKHHASVMANIDKVERAREITEKMRSKQMEHEKVEKKRMEEVFAQYMERRIKAEEKVVSIIFCLSLIRLFIEQTTQEQLRKT